MLVGVSTRSYARSLESVPDDLVTRCTSRPAVSRRFVAATEKQMAEWLGRDLSAIDLIVLMIDGVYVGEDHVLLVALGFDAEGDKHVLGVREGATENAASCTALLADMRDRGLPRRRRRREGTREGDPQRVRRACADPVLPAAQEPQRHRPAARRHASVGAPGAARRVRMRRRSSPSASSFAGSATSTPARLSYLRRVSTKRSGLPDRLARQLSTTSAIENVIGSMRRISARVKRWCNGRMMLRWAVASIADAATRFRRGRPGG